MVKEDYKLHLDLLHFEIIKCKMIHNIKKQSYSTMQLVQFLFIETYVHFKTTIRIHLHLRLLQIAELFISNRCLAKLAQGYQINLFFSKLRDGKQFLILSSRCVRLTLRVVKKNYGLNGVKPIHRVCVNLHSLLVCKLLTFSQSKLGGIKIPLMAPLCVNMTCTKYIEIT